MTQDTLAYYNMVRNAFIAKCIWLSTEELCRLKNIFKEKIDSTRRIDNITNVEELIKILEKRNVLKPSDLNGFKEIAFSLNERYLINLLNNTPMIDPIEPRIEKVRHLFQSANLPTVLNLQTTNPHDRIYEIIMDEIGSRWKDLARKLKIAEGKIDELEDQYRFNPSERIREILLYNERCNARWKALLLLALSECKRNDLCEKIQEILLA